MKTKFILFLLLFSKVLMAQQENDKIIYMDSLWKETTKDKHVYYRIVKEYYVDKGEYRFEDYYKSGKMQMEGTSAKKEILSKTGPFTYYYENGNKKTQVSFEKDIPTGNQTEWYENGVKKMEGEYVMREGNVVISGGDVKTELKINQFWTAENKPEVVNGNGYITETTKDYSDKGAIVNGWKNGVWEGSNAPFTFSYTESYSNGKLISGKSIDKLNIEHQYTKVMQPAKPKKGLDHFYNFIAKKFRIPNGSEKISGKIVVTFVIDKEGDATDVTVVKSLGEDLDNEAIRLIKKYPDWSPGEFRGIQVKTLYSIPISIRAAE